MRHASLLLVLALLVAGCGAKRPQAAKLQPHDPRAAGAAADQGIPAMLGLPYNPGGTITVQRDGYEAGRVHFRGDAAFGAAVVAFAHEAHAARVRVHGMPGAVGFRVDHKRAERFIERWNRKYLRRGAYVFRYENTEGFIGGHDAIIVLPTRDKWAVIRAAAVNGVNYDILNPAIVSWLKRLDAQHPFTVYGAGIDFVEGRFATPPRGEHALVLARSMNAFDPDIVSQGVGSVRQLARELTKTGTLYLWWD